MEFKEYLQNNLKSDFDKKEVEKIEKIFVKSLNEFNTENPEPAKPENKNLEKLFEKIAEKPEIIKEWITEIRKPNLVKSGFKILIALIVVLPITYLGSTGILGTCETSTLFGGIVGYLLGELT